MIKLYHKIISIIIILLLCTSCSSCKYVKMLDDNITPRFNNGRWLVNTVDAKLSNEMKQNLRDAFVNSLKYKTGVRIVGVDSIPKYYSSKIKQSYILSKEELRIPELKDNFDYVLNIRVSFDGQSYENIEEYTCEHTETHYSGNRSYTTTTSHTKNLSDGHLDLNTILEVVVYDLSTNEICYKQGIVSDYSFIPTHASSCECDSESLSAAIVLGIFDAIISTAPNKYSKLNHLLSKSCRKIAREMKRCCK